MAHTVIEDEIHPRARAKLSPQCLEVSRPVLAFQPHMGHQFSKVVMKTKHPFVQLITDVISPSAVFHEGHVILVGDALSGARPHTTAST